MSHPAPMALSCVVGPTGALAAMDVQLWTAETPELVGHSSEGHFNQDVASTACTVQHGPAQRECVRALTAAQAAEYDTTGTQYGYTS